MSKLYCPSLRNMLLGGSIAIAVTAPVFAVASNTSLTGNALSASALIGDAARADDAQAVNATALAILNGVAAEAAFLPREGGR